MKNDNDGKNMAKFEEKTNNAPKIQDIYKVHYFNAEQTAIFAAPEDHSYYFKTFIGHPGDPTLQYLQIHAHSAE